ncbi:MAG: hypothetical protein FJX00_00490, partial [Alphaproteobacteria bacterium]|nr:hypothetical protein [Alphaproteobacteria bacterium]
MTLYCGMIESRKEAFRAVSYGYGKSVDKNQRSKTDSSWENGHKIPFVYAAFLPAAMSHSIKSDLQSFDLRDYKGQKTVPEKFGVHRLGAQHRFGIRYFNKIFSLPPCVLTRPGIMLKQSNGYGQALPQNATFTPNPILTPDENLVKQIQHTEQPEIRLQSFSNDLGRHESTESRTHQDCCHDQFEKETWEKKPKAQKIGFENDLDGKNDYSSVSIDADLVDAKAMDSKCSFKSYQVVENTPVVYSQAVPKHHHQAGNHTEDAVTLLVQTKQFCPIRDLETDTAKTPVNTLHPAGECIDPQLARAVDYKPIDGIKAFFETEPLRETLLPDPNKAQLLAEKEAAEKEAARQRQEAAEKEAAEKEAAEK